MLIQTCSSQCTCRAQTYTKVFFLGLVRAHTAHGSAPTTLCKNQRSSSHYYRDITGNRIVFQQQTRNINNISAENNDVVFIVLFEIEQYSIIVTSKLAM